MELDTIYAFLRERLPLGLSERYRSRYKMMEKSTNLEVYKLLSRPTKGEAG